MSVYAIKTLRSVFIIYGARDIYVINIKQVGLPICGVPDNYRICY